MRARFCARPCRAQYHPYIIDRVIQIYSFSNSAILYLYNVLVLVSQSPFDAGKSLLVRDVNKMHLHICTVVNQLENSTANRVEESVDNTLCVLVVSWHIP